MLIELNVGWRGQGQCAVTEANVSKLGFDVITYTETVTTADSLKKETAPGNVTKANPLSSAQTATPAPMNDVSSMRSLRRLHVPLEKIGDLAPLNQYLKTRRKVWDLVSVKIIDELVWQRLIASPLAGFVDIIQLEWYEPSPPFRPSRHQLALLASLNIYLEVCLDKLLLTPAGVGANFFRNVGLVCRHMPKSHILVTTGASSPLYLRSPQDLYALAATLFGSEPAKRIIYENPVKVIDRAEARKAIGVCGKIV